MNKIKQTFVFTYDRFDEITTSEYLKDIPHTVLCHTKQQEKLFKQADRIYGKLVATGNPRGLAFNRNYALDQMKTGEWAMFWVDDLIECTYLDNYFNEQGVRLNVNAKNQPAIRNRFKQPCPSKTFYKIAEESILHAEEKGYALVGFSLTDNPMFRDRKYSYRGLADGRCWAVKKAGIRFDEKAQLIDDVCFTARNIMTFGGVVVNNWLLPKCKRYTAGAFGTKTERMAQKIKECDYLVKAYPGYIRKASKAGWPEGSHVVLK